MPRSTLRPLRLAASSCILLACGGDSGAEPNGPPASLRIAAGNLQSGDVTAPLGRPIAVQVVDARGRAAPAGRVEFSPIGGSGSGSLSPPTGTSGEDGMVTAMWTLGTSADTQRVVAWLRNSSTDKDPIEDPLVVLKAVARPGPPGRIAVEGHAPFDAPPGTVVAVTARVQDAFGNPLRGVPVRWSIVRGLGSVSPTETRSDTRGYIRVTWTYGPTAGPQDLRAEYSAEVWVILVGSSR